MIDCPAVQARLVYDREPSYCTFKDDLELHMINGYVISTPEILIMARPVDIRAKADIVQDPACHFPENEWNCWHVHLVAGKLPLLFTFLPFRLPYGSFNKRGKLKYYPLKQLMRTFNGFTNGRAKGSKTASTGTATS